MAASQPTAPPTSTAPALAEVTRLRLAIVRLARRQRQQSGTGLTPSLQSALAVIDHVGSMTLGELAATEQVSAPTTTRLVDKLEELGLATRVPDPADRRVTRVTMTEAGREELARSRVRRDAWLQARMDSLEPADVDALLGAIDALEHLLGPEPDNPAPPIDGDRS